MKGFRIQRLLILVLLSCTSCHETQPGLYYFTFYNDSEEVVQVAGHLYSSVMPLADCAFQPSTRLEYNDLIHDLIEPHSSVVTCIDDVVDYLQTHPGEKWSVHVYNFDCLETMSWRDVIKMSCAEFAQLCPLRTVWEFSLEDLEASNWTIVYSSEE